MRTRDILTIMVLGIQLTSFFMPRVEAAGDSKLSFSSESAFFERMERSIQAQNLSKFFLLPNAKISPKCPLQSNSHKDLLNKLAVIKDGLRNQKCEHNNKDLIERLTKNIENIEVNLSTNKDKPDEQAVPSATTQMSKENAETMLKMAMLLEQLKLITKDQTCLEEIKGKGMIGMFADSISSIGRSSMTTFPPYSLAAGSAAIVAGAALNMIDRLFQSRFDWRDEKDRKQFLTMNCAFYELRRELEEREFYHLREDDIGDKIVFGENLIKYLSAKEKELQKKAIEYQQLFSDLDKKYEQEHRANVVELIAWVDGQSAAVEKALAQGKELKKKEMMELVIHWVGKEEKLQSVFALFREQPPYKEHLQSLFATYQGKNLAQFQSMDMDAFISQNLEPKSTYFQDLQKLLKIELSKFDGDKQSALLDLEGLPYEDFKTKLNEKNTSLLEGIAKTKANLNDRIKIMETRANSQVFSAEKDGSQASFDILNIVRGIKGQIFGRLGWGFLSYVLKEGQSLESEFARSYKFWRDKYFGIKQGNTLVYSISLGGQPELLNPSPSQTTWACRDGQKVRMIWESQRSSIELAYDFLVTNKGLMDSDVPNYTMALGFIPVKRSPEYMIFKNMVALEMAQEITQGTMEKTDAEVKTLKALAEENIGLLILGLEKNKAKRLEVEKFLEAHQCSQFL